MIYRVVQEQLNNILKHSKAKSASVELSVTDSEIVLLITDDGVGFDTGTGFQGIGLRNIHNRISLYDGVVGHPFRPRRGLPDGSKGAPYARIIIYPDFFQKRIVIIYGYTLT